MGGEFTDKPQNGIDPKTDLTKPPPFPTGGLAPKPGCRFRVAKKVMLATKGNIGTDEIPKKMVSK